MGRSISKVNILGFPVSRLSMADTVAYLAEKVEEGRSGPAEAAGAARFLPRSAWRRRRPEATSASWPPFCTLLGEDPSPAAFGKPAVSRFVRKKRSSSAFSSAWNFTTYRRAPSSTPG